jgi:hypothetical protein
MQTAKSRAGNYTCKLKDRIEACIQMHLTSARAISGPMVLLRKELSEMVWCLGGCSDTW